MPYSPPTRPMRPWPRGRSKTSRQPSSATHAGWPAVSQVTDAAERKGEGGASAVRILVADADCALYGLLEEWLAGTGYELAGACAPDSPAHDGYDLIVVDVPFPRADVDVLNMLRQEHPGTPI